jgi:predicted KAP-like P-loop ATPase
VRGTTQVVAKLGEMFSQVKLEENKKRLEKILEEANKKLVIFIDDIDRLDKAEIQSILKLVKLSADFKNTTYILAFDEEKVVSAISEKYGSGNLEAGRSFLEKIIQVPLTLPKVSSSLLQKFCFECLEKTLKMSDLELSKSDIRRFSKCFSEGLAVQLKTPRVAQRYTNAITFSVPFLKGEVDIVDLLLIEGVKIFYPKLYDIIRDKQSYFLGELLDQGGDFSLIKQTTVELIERSLADFSPESRFCAKNLLKELFPRLTGVLGNIHHGSDWQTKWTQEKRIASYKYFRRYFIYGIPEDDISDQSLLVFLKSLESNEIYEISNNIKEITCFQPLSTDAFITEIYRKIDNLSSYASSNLALAIGNIGDYFPKRESLYSFDSPFSRSAILVSHLIQRINDESFRLEISQQLIKSSHPIYFATECLRWLSIIKKDEENTDIQNPFSQPEINHLAEILVNRIRQLAKNEEISLDSPENTREILNSWAYWSSKTETNNYLKHIFTQEYNNAIKFLRCYIPIVWSISMEAPYRVGQPLKGAIEKSDYDAIIKVIDAEILVDILNKIYGNELYSLDLQKLSEDQLAAYQFITIHKENLGDTTP